MNEETPEQNTSGAIIGCAFLSLSFGGSLLAVAIIASGNIRNVFIWVAVSVAVIFTLAILAATVVWIAELIKGRNED